MYTIPIAGVLTDVRDLFEGERLMDTLFIVGLLLVGLVAAGVAWRRSVDD